MKIALSFVLLLMTIHMYGQKRNVTVVQMNCETEEIDFKNRHLELFNMEGDKVIADRKEFEELKYKKLEFGKYKAKFTNTYGQIINTELLINQKEITLCTDEFIATNNHSLLDSLSSSDRMSIQFKSRGCFHWSNEKLEISNINNSFYATYWIDDKKEAEIKMTQSDINNFREFEAQLREIGNGAGGCTTLDYYSILYNEKEVFTTIDDSCDWSGFTRIIYKINLKKQKASH